MIQSPFRVKFNLTLGIKTMDAIRGPMTLAGRVMLSVIFLMSAAGNKIPNFSQVAGYMESVGVPAAQMMLAAAIVFLLVGGVSLVVGFKARLGATLLFVFLVLATYFFHNFWAFDPETPEFQQQMIHFMKNIALMGAMLMVMAGGPGPWSIDECRRCGGGLEAGDTNTNVSGDTQ
jgi:putative oxidoreductase